MHCRLCLILAVLLLPMSLVRGQERPTIGVLDVRLMGQDADTSLRQIFTAAIRGAAIKCVKDSLDVIENEKLERLIQVNAVSCSNASCLAKFTRSVGIDYLMETRMLFRKDKWTAVVKLASSRSENLLGEETEDFESESAAKAGLISLASKMLSVFSKKGNEIPLGNQSSELKRAVVLLVSDPPNASVTVDGKFLCLTNSGKSMTEGEHLVEFAKDGYKTRSGKFVVSGNGQEISWKLDPIRTRLILDAVDDQTKEDLIADVYVNGSKVGQTPFNDSVPVSAGSISVQAKGYERKLVDVTLEEGKDAIFRAHFTHPKFDAGSSGSPSGNSSNESSNGDSRTSEILKNPWAWILCGVVVSAGIVSKISESNSNDSASKGWTANVVW